MTPGFARLLMTASAVFLVLLGLPCVFAPDVVLRRLVGNTSTVAEIVVQLTGALYVGFAVLNWMSRGVRSFLPVEFSLTDSIPRS